MHDPVVGFEWFPLNIALTMGTSQTRRLGNTVTLLSLNLSLIFHKATDNAQPCNFVRYLLIYDKQPDGDTAADIDFFQALVGTDTHVNLVRPRNVQVSRRWTVLRDRYLNLCDSTQPWKLVREFISLKGKDTTYQSNTGTIAAVSKGTLYLVVANGLPDAIGTSPTFDGWGRLRYYP